MDPIYQLFELNEAGDQVLLDQHAELEILSAQMQPDKSYVIELKTDLGATVVLRDEPPTPVAP